MKKLFYTFIASLPFFTSCEEADFGVKAADPQSWEQEEAITLPGLTLSPVATVDLANAGDSVVIINPSLSGTIPEGATIGNFRVELVSENGSTTLNACEEGKVKTAELQTAIETAYGKRPEERTFDAIVYANIMSNGQASLIKAETTVSAIPVAPVIESAYYLVGDMFKIDDTNNGWNAVCMRRFSHSDKDVYDDPIFSIVFTTTANNQYWKIIPQTNVDTKDGFWTNPGVVGPANNGESALSATLVNVDAQAGMIEEAGMYKMTINMMDYTYTLSKLAPEYFILGDNPFGWNVNDKKFMLYPQSATVHTYTTKFEGNIKMINSNDMGTDNWAACYGTPTDGDTSESADLVQNAGAIHVPETGYYTLTADFGGMTYTWTKLENQEPTEYTNISLIGDFNGWGGDTDLVEITPHNWCTSNFTVETAGGLKFRANHDWAVNWGATLNVADVNYGVGVGNGDNISVPAGTYNVFFNDITGEFVFQSK